MGNDVGRGVGAGVGEGQLERESVVTVDMVKTAATALSIIAGSAAAALSSDWTVDDPLGVVRISKPTATLVELVERRRLPAAAASMETMFTVCSLTPATSAIAISNISEWSARVLTEMPVNSTVPRTMIGATTGAAVGLPSSGVGYGVIGRGVGAGIGMFVDGRCVGLGNGTCDGLVEGAGVGSAVGAGVGRNVGLGEGAGVGRGVG